MSNATILLVDDNPTNLQVLLGCLQETGFETLIAQSGEGALRQVKYAQPDIILLDVMMPGIDGFETCRRLKEDTATREIPVIFMKSSDGVLCCAPMKSRERSSKNRLPVSAMPTTKILRVYHCVIRAV